MFGCVVEAHCFVRVCYCFFVEFFSLTADKGLWTEESCTVVAVLCQAIENSKQPNVLLETESFQILVYDVLNA